MNNEDEAIKFIFDVFEKESSKIIDKETQEKIDKKREVNQSQKKKNKR